MHVFTIKFGGMQKMMYLCSVFLGPSDFGLANLEFITLINTN